MKSNLALLFALTLCSAARAPAADDTADIQRFIIDYDAAFNAKSMDRLAVFYHPDVTIFEGGSLRRPSRRTAGEPLVSGFPVVCCRSHAFAACTL